MMRSFHGQMLKVSAFGHGICQKVMIVAFGRLLPDHPRRKREMVVLHEHDRIFGPGLLSDGLGEAFVDRFILPPVGLAELRTDKSDVTEWPKAFVGQSVVIAVLFLL